uniref:Uncharacterized protein n=1 Tax=Hyaloperonospora arabidopsidis (strain Emoy2) TaxID=559515 RepID=M4B1Z1_HYAAE
MERRDTCSYHRPRSYTQTTFLIRAFNHINTPNESILYESYGLSIVSIAEYCLLLLSKH